MNISSRKNIMCECTGSTGTAAAAEREHCTWEFSHDFQVPRQFMSQNLCTGRLWACDLTRLTLLTIPEPVETVPGPSGILQAQLRA